MYLFQVAYLIWQCLVCQLTKTTLIERTLTVCIIELS